MIDIKKTKAYIYAKAVVDDDYSRTSANADIVKKYVAPYYVKKQCEEFLYIANGKSDKYVIDEKKVEKIEKLLKLMMMPKGLSQGKSLYDVTCDYQWLFYISVLCIVHREDRDKRKYETAILEIARKNFKTYTISTIFILLMLIEPANSKFYSVAPDGALSREVKDAIDSTIRSSPLIYGEDKQRFFKILRDSVTCNLNYNIYTPLAYTNNKFDGRLPSVFLADEVGALPNSYALEAMRSGQLNIKNKLGCIISTKYPTNDNPFENEIGYAKKVLDGMEMDEKVFALLYEPNDTKAWADDDMILKQANPVALERKEIWEDIIDKRKRAISMPSARENFMTKHCNIIYQDSAESYINIENLKKCKVDKIDFSGRDLYVGVDLSMTTDNTAVSVVAVDDEENLLIDSYCFIPSGRLKEKIATENIDYIEFIKSGKCIECGDETIDYAVVEEFVEKLGERLGGTIQMIGYDRYNAMSSAEKWSKNFVTVDVKQHSSVLNAPTKLLEEKILNRGLKYTENKLLEINFQNAKCVYDTNMNRYVNKKKSSGKIDMVASLINAVYLAQQNIIFGGGGGSVILF